MDKLISAHRLLVLIAAFLCIGVEAQTRKPNIVFIFADDLGYGDTGIYGSDVIQTPNIDALARDGVRFTQGYVSHPVCSPSRAGLITGRYQQRHGWEFNPAGRDSAVGLDLEQHSSSDSDESRISLDKDKNDDIQLRTNNSFLHDNVD